MSADYLFQTDKCYDVCYDTGDKVIQCGRHNDIFKLWLQWRARVSMSTGRHRHTATTDCYQGMSGFEKQINHLMDLTAYQVEKLKSQPDKFYLIVPEPECTNVCFWYIPARLRSEKRDHWWQDELGRATAVLKVRRTSELSVLAPSQHFMIYPI